MNVTIVSAEFHKRDKAIEWIKDKYAEYPDGSIVSSFISQNTAYVVVDKAKLNPPEKKLIKIT